MPDPSTRALTLARLGAALLALGALAACGGDSNGSNSGTSASANAGGAAAAGQSNTPCGAALEQILACAQSAARPIQPSRTLPAPAESPVAYYVDRSGSMTGYLDRDFSESASAGPGSVSFRKILDRLSTLGGANTRVFGFGSALTPVSVRSNQDIIAQLVRQEFYTDDNTRTEDVLDAIAKDTARTTTHLIITDGRRGDGASAMAQYKRMGELARDWAADQPGGGARPALFALAVTPAPFRRVRRDKAGCWTADPTGAAEIRCPLYIFAFVPRADAARVLPVLRSVSGRLYVAPALTDTAISLRLDKSGVTGANAEALRSSGGRTAREPLTVIFGAPAQAQGTVAADVRVRADLGRSAARFSADDSLTIRLFESPLGSAPRWDEVRPQDLAKAWAKPAAPTVDAEHNEVVVPVQLRTRAQVPRTAYRVEVASAGVPGWLGEFEATKQGDSTRTYGLSTLLEHLRARRDTTTLFGFYGVVH